MTLRPSPCGPSPAPRARGVVPAQPPRAPSPLGRSWSPPRPRPLHPPRPADPAASRDRKSTRLNSSHLVISYAVFCLKKKKIHTNTVLDVFTPTPDIHTHKERLQRHTP